ncbi:TSUP family transporter [Nitratifractor sp.]
MEFELWVWVLLFGAGMMAGFVDSIAGGGGIITLPVLLAVGIPPHQALATNKLQSSFGSFTAAMNYSRLGLMNPRELLVGVFFTFLGAASGATVVQWFPADSLESLIIIMLIVIFIYTALTPKLGLEPKPHRIPHGLFYTLFGLLIGFYDGFFGPGTGSFWTMALVLLLGLDLKAATAQTKLFNFTSNIVSLGVFIYAGLVLWGAGVVMGIGQIVGAFLGSTLVHKREVKFIRVFFLTVVAATIVKLLFFG